MVGATMGVSAVLLPKRPSSAHAHGHRGSFHLSCYASRSVGAKAGAIVVGRCIFRAGSSTTVTRADRHVCSSAQPLFRDRGAETAAPDARGFLGPTTGEHVSGLGNRLGLSRPWGRFLALLPMRFAMLGFGNIPYPNNTSADGFLVAGLLGWQALRVGIRRSIEQGLASFLPCGLFLLLVGCTFLRPAFLVGSVSMPAARPPIAEALSLEGCSGV